ncbi:RING-H2 finger protein ATL70-like [Lotus japonicus]|uniref:RING-H2 finger protein ATL70-like n=1 Tax=Lotus japonicus TaxID=34305 RepID=UPI00258E24BD|nr:RING-H2 finger protein ATL70-like [Lotus japonicus]
MSDDQELTRIGYFLVLITFLIVLTFFLTFASYLCTKPPHPISSVPSDEPVVGGHNDTITDTNQITPITVEPAEPRLDETVATTVCSNPNPSSTLLFSKGHEKLCRSGSSSCFCCSICLMDYKESDLLRLLPGCGHFFHVMCVDPWLRMNLSCPVCRMTPIITRVRVEPEHVRVEPETFTS